MNLRLPTTYQRMSNWLNCCRSIMLSTFIALVAIFSFSSNLNAQCNSMFMFEVDTIDTQKVNFTDQSYSSMNPIVSFSWNFGDGNFSGEQHPEHTYPSAGTYQACLEIVSVDTLSGDSCVHSTCDNITVQAGQDPCAGLQAVVQSVSQVCQGSASGEASVLATGGTPPYVYSWNDPQQSTSSTVSGLASGSYVVTVTDGNGCSATAEAVVNEYHALFGFDFDGSDPKLVHFNDQSIVAAPATLYTWIIDGTIHTVSNPSYTFPTDGTYNVCLTVVGADGCEMNKCTDVVIDTQGAGGACQAAFNFTPDSQDSKNISFHNQSNISQPGTYSWDFGNGSTSTEENPQYTYTAEGNYNVCLAVMGADGCADTICSNVFIENQGGGAGSCYADYHFNVDTNDYHNVEFTDNSNGGSGPVVAWTWEFGDGSTSNEQNPQHTYQNDGDYSVCLTTQSDDGCSGNHCMQVLIQHPDSTNGAGGGAGGGCYAAFSPIFDQADWRMVAFENHSGGTAPFTYYWDFADGTTSTEEAPVHQFNQEGEYDVCLTITSADGCSNTMCNRFGVFPNSNDCSGETNYAFTRDSLNGMLYHFQDMSNGDLISAYHWNFGDGNESTMANPSHQYTSDGSYNVCLTVVRENGCSSDHCLNVSVNSGGCVANFGGEMDTTGAPFTIQFENLSNTAAGAAATYLWDFADGTSSTEANPSHTFTPGAKYNVCLTITDGNGCSHTHCQEIDLNDNSCNTNFYFQHDAADHKTVSFVDQSQADAGIAEWNWTFGDGTSSANQNPTHTYTAEGQYTVCLQTMSADSCTSEWCMDMFIEQPDTNINVVDGTCYANFFFEHDTMDYKMLSFHDNSSSASGAITSWSWTFGDNSTASGPNVTHSFPGEGEYDVCLTTVDVNGCQASHCMTVNVVPHNQLPDCFASFTFVPDTSNGFAIQFYVSGSSNINGGYWNFGDGSSSHDKDPYHVFDEAGYYNVCVTAWDSLTGCQVEFCEPIQIGDPNQGTNNCYAEFDLSISGNTVAIMDQSSANINGYFYDFGNGNVSNDENPTYTYPNGGYYNICLTAFDSLTGCQAQFCKSFEIADTNRVNCHADFTFIPSSTDPKEIQFSNTSAGTYTNSHWSFGDNGNSDDEHPNHYFNDGGFYDVCLTVFDSVSGCQANICKPLNLGADSTGTMDCFAEFNFFVDPESGEVVLNNESQGGFTNSHWSFSDGAISDDMNVNHIFTQGGYNGVCLTIWDTISGCQAEVCHDIFIDDSTNVIDACKAEFTYFVDASGEYHFDNISVSAGSLTDYHWSFGDGMFSNNNNPVHFYNNFGDFEVCLTVRDSVSGCMDTYCEWIVRVDTTGGSNNYCFSDFTYVPVAGSMDVVFDNQAQGSFNKVRWVFGDGTESTEFSPNHSYTAPGYYDVCLIVRDTLTNCMAEFCKVVQVGDAASDSTFVDCHADFTYSTEADGSVYFENLSQGHFTKQHWRFGDMTFSDMDSPSHLYTANRDYQVCLTIRDSVTGCMDEVCKQVVVQDFIDSSFVNCEARFSYIFEDESTVVFDNRSMGTFTSSKWYFGNNSFSSEHSPVKSFSNAGVYDVCLMVRDSVSGCMAEFCKPIHIQVGTIDSTVMINDCDASFTYFTEADGSINFESSLSSSITNVKWMFGDGTPHSTMLNPSHFYNPGDYHVRLLARDSVNGCVAEFRQDVFVQDTVGSAQVFCNADFEMFPEANGLVYFENVSAGTYTNVKWQFTDGSTSYNWNADHYFTQFGVQGACLTVYDSISGCMDTYCGDIYVEDTTQNLVDCNAAFEMFPVSATEVDFQNLSSGTYTDFYWSFPGGQAGYTNHATVDFGQSGIVEACLTVRDSVSGCMDTYCEIIELIDTATAAIYCNADFTYFAQDEQVYFEAMSMGTVTNVFWDFDNGYNSNEMYPQHTFDPGFYQVTLTVYDSLSGCMATTSQGINIDTDEIAYVPCEADFGTYVEQDTTIVHFSDFSTGGANTWYWSFGDNTVSSTDQNPTHTYDADGYYEVCLTIATDNGCQESFCQVIAVGDVSNSCYADFNYYADQVTATAHFNNVSLGNLDAYEWSFGDASTSFQYAPSHTYADTGYYATCLTVRNTAAGCEATKCQDIRVGNALENKCLFNCVWPGDANNDEEANHYDLLAIGFNYGLTGPARDSSSILWMGHEATDWSTAQWTGVNNRHGDCDGDGIIDENDIAAIQQNFAFSHPNQPYKAAEDLTFEIINPDLVEGEDMIISVKAGEDAEISMYGIGFEIGLDPTKFDFNSLSVDYSNSWLGSENTDMITVAHAEEGLGQLFVALSRNDHTERSGQGEIARLTINAIGIDEEGTEIDLSTAGGMDAQGDTIPFTSDQSETIIINSIQDQVFAKKDIAVYPNPTKGQINFNLPSENGTFNINVYDQLGNLVYSEARANGGNVNLNLDHIANGVYMLEVTHENVQYIQRFNMLK